MDVEGISALSRVLELNGVPRDIIDYLAKEEFTLELFEQEDMISELRALESPELNLMLDRRGVAKRISNTISCSIRGETVSLKREIAADSRKYYCSIADLHGRNELIKNELVIPAIGEMAMCSRGYDVVVDGVSI